MARLDVAATRALGEVDADAAQTDALEALDRLTRTMQDFPRPGVLFRDVTPVLADPSGLRRIAVALASGVHTDFDLVAGLDARGFLLGGAVGALFGTGVLAIRKAGKLAGAVLAEDYELEYGAARLELHPDDVPDGARVLIVDDVLATGGTAGAAIRLLQRAGADVVGVSVMVELLALGGRAALAPYPAAVHAISSQ